MDHFTGPVVYPGMNVEVHEDGIEAPDFKYEPQDAMKPGSWEAEWIWLNQDLFPDRQNSYYTDFCNKEGYLFTIARFRREVMLGDNIESVKAWVSADVKYRLYINRQAAGRGPAEPGGDYGNTEPLGHWYYDCYDFSHLFKPGNNVICAEVLLLPQVQADYSVGHGGFLFEAEVQYEGGRYELIVSDTNWRATVANSYESIVQYDAQKEHRGWMGHGYDDTEWRPAHKVDRASGGRWNLIPREIPPLMEARMLPVEVRMPFPELGYRLQNGTALLEGGNSGAIVLAGAPFTFWLDFGRTLSGYIRLKVNGPAGTKLALGAEEIIGKTENTEAYICGEGAHEYEGFRLQSIRYLKVTVSNMTGQVELYEIGVNFISYPVGYAGSFHCSDDLLNKIYKVGRWSNQICRQAYHLDSPIHQEALGCTGDYMIESLMNYYTFGDKWLTRMDILRTAYLLEQKKGVMFHTSYSLLWVQMLMDYYQFTGDETLNARLASTVNMLLEQFEGYRGETGLIDHPPNYMFMDWVPVGNYNLHHPPRTLGQGYISAFYYKALLNGARISRMVGDVQRATQYERRADEVKEAFNKLLWIEELGLYCDGRNGDKPTLPNKWLPEDAEGAFFSQHTNSLAVLYDIAPKEIHADIMRKVFDKPSLIQAQPYFMHFVLEAAAHAGVFGEYGLNQIRRWKLLLDENPTSLKEVWHGFDCDYSHAWGGTPTYQLASKVLGITPIEPGFKVIGIKPVFADLKRAKGQVLTPMGTVTAGWSRNISRNSILTTMDISIPQGCKAVLTFSLVEIGSRVLTRNGETIWFDGSFIRNSLGIQGYMDASFVNLEVLPGNYSFTFQQERESLYEVKEKMPEEAWINP